MPRRARRRGPSLTRVRAVIAALALSGAVSLELAAARLQTSPRSLQRRLREREVRFGALVAETRLGIAAALLRDTELSVQEIAARMGYGAPSGFARAFGRWAGLSPRAYRNAPEWSKSPSHRELR